MIEYKTRIKSSKICDIYSKRNLNAIKIELEVGIRAHWLISQIKLNKSIERDIMILT